MKHAVLEFLTDELKMDEQEIDDLGSFAVTRKDVEGNKKVYDSEGRSLESPRLR